MICPNCGQELRKKAKFCSKCGEKQIIEKKSKEKKFCINCNKQIKEEDEYCPNCGTKIKEEVIEKEKIEKTPSIKKKRRWIVISVIILIILVLFFLPIFPTTKQVPYSETLIQDNCDQRPNCYCDKRGGFLWLTCVRCVCQQYRTTTEYHTLFEILS